MADYHVLTGSVDANSFSVVHHIPIPGSGTNRAGVQWRTALINSGLGGRTVLPDGDGTGGTVSAAEKASIEAGAVFEVAEQVATHPGETALQLRDRIDARHTALVAAVQAQLQGQLSYYGFTRTGS